MFPVTMLYAGLVALLFLRLSFGVIRIRRRERIPFHDGGNAALTRAVRAQGNCAEYAPLLLILMALMESAGTLSLPLHLFGIALVASRCLHAYSLLSHEPRTNSYACRFWAMFTTFALLGASGVTLIAITLIKNDLFS